MIIFMQLRDIAIQSATTLASILFQIERGPKPEEVLAAIKDCDGAHILFVLDGWDEFPPGLHGDSMIKDLICRPADVGMSSRTIIITSRPIASAELRRRYASSRVEIVGFRKAEMKRYFEEAIGEPHIVQKLEDHLKLRPALIFLSFSNSEKPSQSGPGLKIIESFYNCDGITELLQHCIRSQRLFALLS